MPTSEQPVFEGTARLKNRFIHLVDNLSGVRELAALSVEKLSYEDLVDAMMRILFEHMSAETISLYIHKNDELQCIASIIWEKFIDNVKSVGTDRGAVPIGTTLIGKTAEKRCLQHISNCADANQPGNNALEYDAGSVIYAPVINADKVIGVIELYHPHGEHFDNWQEYAMIIYADMIGVLFDYHGMMSNMQHQLNERTAELRNALEESERLRKRYEEMSVIDHLTKLYNRRYFFSEVSSALARAIRYEQPFSLMMMDLDHFKDVNDNYGHDCGDELLKFIADCLSRFTREGDTLARYGGEEFIMALPNTNLDGALQLAERIRQTIENNDFTCKGQVIKQTISIGLTSIDNYQERKEEVANFTPQVADLIRESDRALYFVKQHGRNGVKAFHQLSNP